MHEYFLKFADRAEAEAVLGSIGIVPVDGTWPCSGEVDGNRFDLDVVFGTGILWRATGETAVSEGPDGSYEYQVAAAVPGYHINMRWRGEAPAGLMAYHLVPDNPACRFG
jgi:hypothetical protein